MTEQREGALVRQEEERCHLDATIKDELCALMQLGFRRRVAAVYAGTTDHKVFAEMERDAEFRGRVRLAARSAEARLLKAIVAAAEKHWQAAAWALERMHPERYLKTAPAAVTPEQLEYTLNQFVEIVFEQVPEPARREAIQARLAQLVDEQLPTAGEVSRS